MFSNLVFRSSRVSHNPFWLFRLAALCLALPASSGCGPVPPKEDGPFLQPDLVDLAAIDQSIRLDIRYASTNNFTNRKLYRQARAFLQRPAAEALARAQRSLQSQGYGIILYDAYRPWNITVALWEATDEVNRQRGFVADPKVGSKHNRGCAVDIGLLDATTGLPMIMPSGYDEFSERAYPDYAGGPDEPRRLRDLLRRAMEAEGFTVSPREWWHFDYANWRSYPILNLDFEEIG